MIDTDVDYSGVESVEVTDDGNVSRIRLWWLDGSTDEFFISGGSRRHRIEVLRMIAQPERFPNAQIDVELSEEL